MIFTTYFTPSYARRAKRLELSLREFGLSMYGELVNYGGPERKDRLAASKDLIKGSEKPGFLLKMLNQFPGESICWIDADMVVLRRPDLILSSTADVSVRENVWGDGTKRFCAAVVAVTPTDRTRFMLEAWQRAHEKDIFCDDWGLDRAIRRSGGLIVNRLPESYLGHPKWRREEQGILPREDTVIGHVGDE